MNTGKKSKKQLHVLVLFDCGAAPPENQDFTEELKTADWLTEASVLKALKKLGHEVSMVGIYDSISPLVNSINKYKPDVVFNLAEVFHNKYHLDKNIVSLLEMFGVPYTGSGPTALALCNNKVLTKKILTYHRIKVPNFQVFRKGKKFRPLKRLSFPVIVKPVKEEASTGIVKASFAMNANDLYERVKFIHERFNSDAIAEHYIEGRELYLSILGNRRLRTLPLREIRFGQIPDDEPKIATYKAKWDNGYRKRWSIKNEFADGIPPEIDKKIRRLGRKAYHALNLQGYGRFDLRLTPDGEVFVLEANANPSLAPNDEVAESAKKIGITYEKLTQRILNLGLAAYNPDSI